MDDTFTLKQNKNGLWEKYEPFCSIDCETEGDFNRLKTALEFHEKMKWISVEERLPEDNVPVLVHKNRHSEAYGNLETAYYHRGKWRGCIGETITHWMPLPETPKMKGGDTDA